MTENNLYQVSMNRLLQYRWYLLLIIKIKEYMKKMNNSIPICCIKYITVLQYILMIGYKYNKDLFYIILEKTIINKEDHLKTIVHVLLKGKINR